MLTVMLICSTGSAKTPQPIEAVTSEQLADWAIAQSITDNPALQLATFWKLQAVKDKGRAKWLQTRVNKLEHENQAIKKRRMIVVLVAVSVGSLATAGAILGGARAVQRVAD
jgi:hypothetical protein